MIYTKIMRTLIVPTNKFFAPIFMSALLIFAMSLGPLEAKSSIPLPAAEMITPADQASVQKVLTLALKPSVQINPVITLEDLHPELGNTWTYQLSADGTSVLITGQLPQEEFRLGQELARIHIRNPRTGEEQEALILAPGGGTAVLVIADL